MAHAAVDEYAAWAADLRAENTRRVAELLTTPGIGDRDLAAVLQQVELTRRTLTLDEAAVVHEVDVNGWFANDGHRTVKGWVGATLDQSGVTTHHLAGLADFLTDHPDIATHVAAGRLGLDQAKLLAAKSRNHRIRDAFATAVDELVNVAINSTYDVFHGVIDGWAELADQDGAHRPDGEAHKERHCSLRPVGDRYVLKGEWGAIEGRALLELLDHFCQTEYLADKVAAQVAWEEAGNSGDAPASCLPRTARQRAADAFKAMAFAGAAAPPDHMDPVVDVTLNVLIDWATFQRHLANIIDPLHQHRHADDPTLLTDADVVAAGDGVPSAAVARIAGLGMSRLVDGTALDPADAINHGLLYGHIRRAIYDGSGVIIDLGRRSRCFRGGAREAALVQAALDNHQRCLWPGCTRRHVHIDHVTEWQHEGLTNTNNSGTECGHHNVLKSSGYRTWRDPTGTWHHYRPDGSEIISI